MLNQNALKGRIVSAGYTQKKLAREIGISRSNMSLKINGHQAFNLDEVLKMCELLGIENPQEKTDIFLARPSQ